jgi:hypothetical protein
VEKYLDKAENILYFMTEAKELLGFKQNIKNRKKFEAERFILPREVDDGVETVDLISTNKQLYMYFFIKKFIILIIINS